MKLTYNRFIAAVFCILLLALVGVPVSATTYYVSTTGNDSNDGLTEASPLLSIDIADRNGWLHPGDIVNVAAGTYDIDAMPYDAFNKAWGFSTRVCNGTALAPITYRAQGNVTINLGTGNSRTWWVISNHLVIDGFHINGGANGVNIREGNTGSEVKNCWFSNSPLPVQTCLGAGDIKIHNNVIGPSTGPGMYVDSSWGGVVYGTTYVYNNTFIDISAWAFCNWTPTLLKNNIFYHCTNMLYSQTPSTLTNSNNMFCWGVYGVTYGGFAVPGAGEVENDPMFVDAINNDYHLQAGSPAIDTGTIVGMPYNGTAPDMGAFETDAAQVLPGIVTGTVTDSVTGQPISGVTVRLIDGSGGVGVDFQTGANGVYTIEWAAGTWTLTTLGKLGYRAAITSATIVSNESRTVNIQLTPATSPSTFYVSTSGNDVTNDGLSAGSAWATIDKGDRDSLLIPGDTVVVLEGTYDISGMAGITLSKCGGNAAAPITYRAQGSVNIYRGATVGAAVTLTGAAKNIVLDGFQITGGSPIVSITTNGAGAAMTNDEIKNCWLSGKALYYNDPALSLRQVGGNKIHHNLIDPQSDAARGIQSWASPGGDRIDNNTIVNTTDWAFLYLTTTQPVEFKNNIISGSPTGIFVENAGSQLDHTNNAFFNVDTPYGGSAAPGVGETTTVDPLLTFDYHLGAGSPAIDAGIFVGLSYNGSAPDLGAFESAGAATSTGVVSGRVTSAAIGLGLSGALVQLKDGAGTAVASATTDSDGYYSISWLTGSWTVAVSNARGYADASSGATITADTTTVVNFSLTAVVQTYYVGPSGNDSNSGTSADQAWATVDKGDRDNLLNPGDTVVVLEGTYDVSGTTGIVLNKCGGNVGAPITYTAQGNVIIDRGTNSGAALTLTGAAQNIVLDGFHITGGSPILEITTGGAGAAMTNDEVKNCRLSNKAVIYNDPALSMRQVGGNKIHHNIIDPQSVVARGMQSWASPGGDKIDNNTIVNTTDWAFLYLTTTQPAEFKNNIISGSPTGIFVENSGSQLDHTNNILFGVTTPYGGVATAGAGETTTVDPMLVNPTDGDFRLRVGSPAINAGVDVGLPFLGTAPDLGALESNPATSSVAGIVSVNTSGNPGIAGATVQTVGGSVVSTTTNVNGSYSLDLSAGSYTLEASKEGCLPLQKSIVVANGGVTVVDFALNLDLTEVATIQSLSMVIDGKTVRLAPAKAVTVSSDIFGDGSYYIEEPDRTAGIKVVGGTAVAAGDR
ncbi:MAG: carboxypeptidase regulatory-like domain-containing protein, partial [Armatimonadota bacterium]